MRILIIAHKMPYPPRCGATLRNYNLIKECAKTHKIHLITFTQEPYLRDPAKLRASIDKLKQYCEEVKVFRIPTDGNKLKWLLLLSFNLFSLLPYSVWRFWSEDMAAAIKDSLARNKFDVVEIGTIALLKYSNLAPGIPKLLVHHNIESELLKRRSKTEKNPLARAYLALQAFKLKRLEIKASKFVDHHTTVSELDKQILLKSCPNIKVTVVDNGVDTEYFTPGDEIVEQNTLVYAGGMSWYPNAEAMIYFSQHIWPLLKKEIPDIKMNLVGANPPSELLKFCKTEPQFRMLGFVDDVRPIIRKSAVYIVPITMGGGTRLKILDAMAMGKAIVSTSIGAEGIEAKDGVEIIIADKPLEFAEKVQRIIEDHELRLKLEENSREFAINKYSWRDISSKLINIYDSLIS